MPPSRVLQPPIAHTARPGLHEESFQALMARELARAPWFMLSLALHAVAILIANWMMGMAALKEQRMAQGELVLPTREDAMDLAEAPEETIAVEAPAEDNQRVDEPDLRVPEPEPQKGEPAFDPNAYAPGFEGIGLTALRGAGKGRGGGGGDDIFGMGSEALRRGGLRTTVSRLRSTGFEIVFVFDSTGSMGDLLAAAKRRIFRMVEVLHALVPAARIGIVTYRDHGRAEDYVTRSIPVTHDVYRVMNFMHTIDAGGGGDFPEAVLDALKEAMTQRWLPDSRRVVVLIGDAPPHKEDERNVRAAVQGFARGQAYVHTIATTEGGRSARPNEDTQRTFEAIAKDGKGQFSLLEGQDSVLQQVLTLAFGSENRRDLDEVYALVDKRTQRTEVSALDVVQRGDFEAIERALRRSPVDDEIVKAAIKLENPAVAKFMVEKMGDAGFPPHGRQACSFAVMQILKMRLPPLDPESDAPLPRREVEGLLRKLSR